MIELSIEDFILWVVSLPIVVIGLFYLFSGVANRGERLASSRYNVRCRGCGSVFQDATREKHPQCPECGRKNHRKGAQKFG